MKMQVKKKQKPLVLLLAFSTKNEKKTKVFCFSSKKNPQLLFL